MMGQEYNQGVNNGISFFLNQTMFMLQLPRLSARSYVRVKVVVRVMVSGWDSSFSVIRQRGFAPAPVLISGFGG